EDRLSRKISISDTVSLQTAIDHESSSDPQVWFCVSKFNRSSPHLLMFHFVLCRNLRLIIFETLENTIGKMFHLLHACCHDLFLHFLETLSFF
ncbi:hypothetical protein XENOCAPTIV_023251, partial [Xenoophorus captivus]